MMTNDEGGAILRNMKDEYVNGGMLSAAEVRGDIGDPTNLLIHRYEVTAEREKKASKGNKMGRQQRCFAKWRFRDFVFCKEIFYTEKNNQHDDRDAKSGELGEPFRAISPPICAN